MLLPSLLASDTNSALFSISITVTSFQGISSPVPQKKKKCYPCLGTAVIHVSGLYTPLVRGEVDELALSTHYTAASRNCLANPMAFTRLPWFYGARLKVEGNRAFTSPPSHCEARSAVAIHIAVPFSGTAKEAERPSGLPALPIGPRNDELEGERTDFVLALCLTRFFLHF
jgi:hypothetical protein